MTKKVFDYIQKYHMLEKDDTVVVGVSGGADSVCLLFVLLEIRKMIPIHVVVVHVNHGIRKEASQDADYVRRICEEHELPFYLKEENIKMISENLHLSEEEAGRTVRYKAFEEALKKQGKRGKIAVAHNENDLAETMLFHLFRGTGLTGAAGIRPVNGVIIRPLLCIGRAEIEEWLREKKITYCTDFTNEEDAYTRNRIRHHILPYAEKEICKGAIHHMGMAAENLAAADDYIEKQVQKVIAEFAEWNEAKTRLTISIECIFALDAFLQGRLILACIQQVEKGKKNITSTHIQSIIGLLQSESSGSKELHLPSGMKVFKIYDFCVMEKEQEDWEDDSKEKEYLISLPGCMRIPGLGTVLFSLLSAENSDNIPQKKYTKWFDCDKITKSMVFRTRKQGDYMIIDAKMHQKSLQDYFVNEKIPKQKRERLYVLAEGAHVIWVPGYRISEFYKVDAKTRTILQIEIIDDE